MRPGGTASGRVEPTAGWRLDRGASRFRRPRSPCLRRRCGPVPATDVGVAPAGAATAVGCELLRCDMPWQLTSRVRWCIRTQQEPSVIVLHEVASLPLLYSVVMGVGRR